MAPKTRLVAIQRRKADIYLHRHNSRWVDTPDKERHLETLYLRELGILQRQTMLEIQLERDPTYRAKAPKPKTMHVKSYGAKRLETPMDTCGICLQVHTFKDGLMTECGHCFGRTCFSDYKDFSIRSRTALTCPMCRKNAPVITVFNERKKKV